MFIYYFDRIKYISFFSPEELQQSLPLNALLQNTNNENIIRHHDGKDTSDGKPNWYKSRLDAVCCNDEFMNITDTCDMRTRHFTINHLEVAKDLIFFSYDDAKQYEKWFINNVTRNYSRKQYYEKGVWRLGKNKGDKTRNYLRAYIRPSKVTGVPCYHVEFVFTCGDIITRRVRRPFGPKLTDAMWLYYQLEEKYLRYDGMTPDNRQKIALKRSLRSRGLWQ